MSSPSLAAGHKRRSQIAYDGYDASRRTGDLAKQALPRVWTLNLRFAVSVRGTTRIQGAYLS